jgi:hypothetical protein
MALNTTSSLTSLFFPTKCPGVIGTVNIDCVFSENTTEDCEVTDYPIETGAYIQDNIYNRPLNFSLSGFLTDTPLGYIQTVESLTNTTNQSLSQSAIDALETLKESRTPFTVITGVRIYEDMVFTNLSFSRDTNNGRSANIDCSFKKLLFASYQTVQVPASQVSSKVQNAATQYPSTQDNGHKQPSEVTNNQAASDAYNFVHS